jgi:hypothetical protein
MNKNKIIVRRKWNKMSKHNLVWILDQGKDYTNYWHEHNLSRIQNKMEQKCTFISIKIEIQNNRGIALH